ncbi:hypothetical protein [Allosphingosinicella sp.]|uniref:hypothetical protein n=1 Tax=Allosphingosinicella sp. TaxID=2823234 RepID=UPI002FC13CAB
MSNLSLSSVSDDTGAFFRREAGLVMTVAFATFGLGLLLVELMTPDPAAGGQVTPGNWMLWLVPAALLGIVGQLTISLLVLTPGTSVREAMGAGLRRLPTVLLVTLVLGLVAGIAIALFTVVGGAIAVVAGMAIGGATALVSFLLGAFILWGAARLLLIWPLIAERAPGAVDSVRGAWRLSRGHAWRFAAAVLAFMLVYVVVVGAARFGFGSLFVIVGQAIGSEALARFLPALAVAAIGAGLQAVWAVFITQLYRGVSEGTTGT